MTLLASPPPEPPQAVQEANTMINTLLVLSSLLPFGHNRAYDNNPVQNQEVLSSIYSQPTTTVGWFCEGCAGTVVFSPFASGITDSVIVSGLTQAGNNVKFNVTAYLNLTATVTESDCDLAIICGWEDCSSDIEARGSAAATKVSGLGPITLADRDAAVAAAGFKLVCPDGTEHPIVEILTWETCNETLSNGCGSVGAETLDWKITNSTSELTITSSLTCNSCNIDL